MYGKDPDIVNVCYNEHILPVPWHFVVSVFHIVDGTVQEDAFSYWRINVPYWLFWCEVSPRIFMSCAVFWQACMASQYKQQVEIHGNTSHHNIY